MMKKISNTMIYIYYSYTLFITVCLLSIEKFTKKVSNVLYVKLNTYYRNYHYIAASTWLVCSKTLLDSLRSFSHFKCAQPRNQATTHFEYDKQPNKTCIHGFTLVELIVTVSIMAIIIVLAAPNILTQLSKMEAERIRYRINNTLSIAKAESLIRRQDLLVCLSDTNGRCNKSSNNTLLLFADNNGNQHFDLGTDLLIDQQQLKPKYATLHLHAGRRDFIKFYGNSGKPTGHFGHIKYCPNSIYNHSKYQISFNQGAIVRYKSNNNYPTNCSA